MTMTASGSISLDNIQTEFGGANPISLSEYYRGGSYVPSHPGTSGIAASGTIDINSFYSKSRIWYVYVTIAANQADYNLRSAITAATGYDLAGLSVPVYAYVTINAGVYCQSSSTGSYGFYTGTGWPSSSYIQLTNNGGYITGKGGAGGAGGLNSYGGSAGAGAGSAILLGYSMTIYNSGGYIYGGGGGGGGGGSASVYGYQVGGGGGGGGASSPSYTSAGGAAGSASTFGGYNPAAGGAGGSSAGAGGAGGAVVWVFGETSGTAYSGAGGAGGAYGDAGAAGAASTYAAGGAGAAGNAVSLGGYTVTWGSGYNGTQVKGAVS